MLHFRANLSVVFAKNLNDVPLTIDIPANNVVSSGHFLGNPKA